MTHKLVLKVTGPDREEQVEVADPGSVVVGSGPGAGLRIEDPQIGALHSMVKVERGEVMVVDLGSEHGTFLAGERIASAKLRAGEAFRVGEYQVELVSRARPAPARPRWLDEEPGPGDAPADDDKELEVSMLWGEVLLDVRRFRSSAVVTLGRGPRSDFFVDAPEVGDCLALARSDGSRCELSAPGSATVLFKRDPPVGAAPVELGLSDRAQVTIGALCFRVRWVRAEGKLEPRGRARDWRFASIVATSLASGVSVLAAFLMTDTAAQSLSDDLFRNPERYRVVLKAPDRALKAKIDLQLARRMPKLDAPAVKKDSAPGPMNPLKRETDKAKVMRSGLLVFLGGADGASSNVFNSSGLGTRINESLGTMRGTSGQADAGGIAGIGSRGVGPGGPGDLGIGGLGTRPGGRGHGGPEFSFGGGMPKHEARIPPQPPVVIGGCERPVVGKVVNRHASEIRYCYEVGQPERSARPQWCSRRSTTRPWSSACSPASGAGGSPRPRAGESASSTTPGCSRPPVAARTSRRPGSGEQPRHAVDQGLRIHQLDVGGQLAQAGARRWVRGGRAGDQHRDGIDLGRVEQLLGRELLAGQGDDLVQVADDQVDVVLGVEVLDAQPVPVGAVADGHGVVAGEQQLGQPDRVGAIQITDRLCHVRAPSALRRDHRRPTLNRESRVYTAPWSLIAWATLRNPATLAPTT